MLPQVSGFRLPSIRLLEGFVLCIRLHSKERTYSLALVDLDFIPVRQLVHQRFGSCITLLAFVFSDILRFFFK